jgi:predicted transcriptional regulator
MKTSPYTIRLADDVRAALELEAKREDRSAAQLATQAIKTMLAQKNAYHAAIDTALEETTKGRFISQAAMHKWIDSWSADSEQAAPTIDIIR